MKNIRIQYTSWEEMPADVQAFFIQWMGNDAERAQTFFELYFYWFVPAHEVAHALRGYYSTHESSHWREETACNSFAVAYWKTRGETKRLWDLREFVREAIGRVADPVPQGENRSDYFDRHYAELGSNPPAYGHYQFSMVLNALEEKLGLTEVLRMYIMPQATEGTAPSTSPYLSISPDLPIQIVHDMKDYLAPFGVDLPDIRVIRSYSPNIEFVDWDD
jgi:hypothetical protein